ncbi:MAG: hypothetical protein WD602_02320 [Actinomycetota bacterium]
MELRDPGGKQLREVTVRLDGDEVTELLVAASELDDGTSDHALLRSRDGVALAVYRTDNGPSALQSGTDWWMGPLVLLALVLLVVGAYTIARGIVVLIF